MGKKRDWQPIGIGLVTRNQKFFWKNGVKVGLETHFYESGEKKHGDTLWIRMKT
jgi:antitoxin component YwqK of YwqJK toxin-antitoxin module